MRLPEIVLTTLLSKPFSTVSYYTSSMISATSEIRYEVLNYSAPEGSYPRSSSTFWYSA
jgi:hypothetical protein